MDSLTKITRGVTKLAFSHPFFGSMAMSCGHLQDDSIPTMCTDGLKIYWSGPFTDTLDEDETRGVLAHEVMHIALSHCVPHPGKDPKMCNIAMDYVINYTLKKEGFKLPKSALYDTKFADMSWQQVYAICEDLYKKYQQKEGGLTADFNNPNDDGSFPVINDGQGNGKPMTDQEGNGSGAANDAEMSEEDQETLGEQLANAMFNPDIGDVIENSNMTEEQKNDIRQKVVQAAQAQKNSGKGGLPGVLEGLIDEIRANKVDWKEYLYETIQSRYPIDYTYRRGNRKFISQGLFMPSMDGTVVGSLAFCLDTSGSVSHEEREEYLAEINFISNEFRPEKVYIIYVDAEVANVEEYDGGEEITQLNMKGYGGTSFWPAFKYIEDNGIELDQLVYFSDMCVSNSDFPKEEPDYPCLFLSTREYYNVPFGECITTSGKTGENQ